MQLQTEAQKLFEWDLREMRNCVRLAEVSCDL